MLFVMHATSTHIMVHTSTVEHTRMVNVCSVARRDVNVALCAGDSLAQRRLGQFFEGEWRLEFIVEMGWLVGCHREEIQN